MLKSTSHCLTRRTVDGFLKADSRGDYGRRELDRSDFQCRTSGKLVEEVLSPRITRLACKMGMLYDIYVVNVCAGDNRLNTCRHLPSKATRSTPLGTQQPRTSQRSLPDMSGSTSSRLLLKATYELEPIASTIGHPCDRWEGSLELEM
jgi:hypothetical protein